MRRLRARSSLAPLSQHGTAVTARLAGCPSLPYAPHSYSGCPRATQPQGRIAASGAPALSLLLVGSGPSLPPPTMSLGPARTSPGPEPRLLSLLTLLTLLLPDAGSSHTAPAQSNPPAAADSLAWDKDPQRFLGDAAAALGPGAQDMVAVHMLRLYEKYSRRGPRPGAGNTVRSFRPRLGK